MGENGLIVTEGVVVAVCVVVTGPLQPAALAVIIVAPLQPAIYVTCPVALFIVFPAAKLVASILYVIPVELVAEVVYVTVPAP